ncbi:MAG: cation transporter [Candidatus Cloacimonas sp. SDB]|nr:MAG: cation transporter [Candidatus Cloacimonas sp. SDB]
MKIAGKHNWNNLEAIVAIILNLLLFLVKLWAGIVSNSVGIIADAWHTLSDSFSSVIVLISVKFARKPPDKEHPYGHGRAEIVAAVIIGTLLAVIGFNFLLESVKRFNEQQAADFGLIAIIIIIISLIIKELMAQFAFWCARKSGSDLIKADGWHHRSDALSSLMVLAGIFLSRYFWWIDSVMGLLISIFLFHAAYSILKTSVTKLLGEPADKNFTRQIIEVINKTTDLDIHPHHFHCHNYGEHKEISLHIVLDPDLKLSEAHKIANDIEENLRNELKIEATIHIEPQKQ